MCINLKKYTLDSLNRVITILGGVERIKQINRELEETLHSLIVSTLSNLLNYISMEIRTNECIRREVEEFVTSWLCERIDSSDIVSYCYGNKPIYKLADEVVGKCFTEVIARVYDPTYTDNYAKNKVIEYISNSIISYLITNNKISDSIVNEVTELIYRICENIITNNEGTSYTHLLYAEFEREFRDEIEDIIHSFVIVEIGKIFKSVVDNQQIE